MFLRPPSRPFHAVPALLAALVGIAAAPLPQAPEGDPTGPAGPAGPEFGKHTIDAFLAAARTRALDACKQKGLALPADFLAWIDGDPLLRASVYGCRKDPLPVLLGLRSLEIDLGEALVRRDYPQLALAFAIADSYRAPSDKASGWNDGDGAAGNGALPDIHPRPPLELHIPGDPRVRVDTKATDRPLDRDDHIVNFLEDHAPIEVEVTTTELPPLEYDEKGVAKPRGKPVKVKKKVTRGLIGADVIASKALQDEFNAYMKGVGQDVALDCGDKIVHWQSTEAVGDEALRKRIAAAHELFHTAYRNKGRMPAERDHAPTPAESMAWFVRNDRWPFPADTKTERHWPRFPLNAPWPVLTMLAADDQPLREREEIWTKFRDAGEFRTYGEYIGGIAQQFDMQSARRVAPFAFSYGSIQMMWKDGGVCGTMGNIGARTYRIVGVPSSTAGQPGHCAIVLMEHDDKQGYRCVGGQYATGGDEVTHVHARWMCDDAGERKMMVWHQAVAWGVNAGLADFVDTLVLRRVYDAMPPEARASSCVPFTKAALGRSVYAIADIEAALAAAPDAATALAIGDVFRDKLAAVDKAGERGLYRDTVRDLVFHRVLALPAPTTAKAHAELLADLEKQDCALPALLARCWRGIDGDKGFAHHCTDAAKKWLASPKRGTDKHAADAFAAAIDEWGKSVPDAGRKAWAEAVLAAFAGKEALGGKGKAKGKIDPAVVVLCKMAGREVPKSDG